MSRRRGREREFPQGIYPIDFPEANTVLHPPPGMPTCHKMSYHRGGPDGHHWVGCWRVGWRERLAILLGGRVYTSIVSHQAAPPLGVFARRGDVFVVEPRRPLGAGVVARACLLVALLGLLVYGMVVLRRTEEAARRAIEGSGLLPTPSQVEELIRAFQVPAPPDTNSAPAAVAGPSPSEMMALEDQEHAQERAAAPRARRSRRGHPDVTRVDLALPAQPGADAGAIYRQMRDEGLALEPAR